MSAHCWSRLRCPASRGPVLPDSKAGLHALHYVFTGHSLGTHYRSLNARFRRRLEAVSFAKRAYSLALVDCRKSGVDLPIGLDTCPDATR